MPLEVEVLAYAAGLIDGEGSISSSPSLRCKTNYRVILTVAMCDREGVDYLANNFGGKVRMEKRKTKTGKSIYTWTIFCKKAAIILQAVLPYLKVKRQKALDAIQLAGLMHSRGFAKMHIFTDEEIAIRHDLANKIRQANRASNGRIQCL